MASTSEETRSLQKDVAPTESGPGEGVAKSIQSRRYWPRFGAAIRTIAEADQWCEITYLLLRSCQRSSQRSGPFAALGAVIQADQRFQIARLSRRRIGRAVRSCVRENAEVNHCSSVINLLLQSHGRVAQIAAGMHPIPTGCHRAAPVRKRRESWVSVLTPMKQFPAVGRLQ